MPWLPSMQKLHLGTLLSSNQRHVVRLMASWDGGHIGWQSSGERPSREHTEGVESRQAEAALFPCYGKIASGYSVVARWTCTWRGMPRGRDRELGAVSRQRALQEPACWLTCQESSQAGAAFHDSSEVERCEALGPRDTRQQVHPNRARPLQDHLDLHMPAAAISASCIRAARPPQRVGQLQLEVGRQTWLQIVGRPTPSLLQSDDAPGVLPYSHTRDA